MSWKPLISDKLDIKKVNNLLNILSNQLINKNLNKNPSLLNGSAGIGFYFEYLAKYTNEQLYKDYSLNFINFSLLSIKKTLLPYTFCSGIAGIVWSYYHLIEIGAINSSFDEIIGEDIDTFLFQSSLNDLRQGNYDYLHGGLGTFIYFAEHRNKLTNKFLKDGLASLMSSSKKFKEGITWVDKYKFISEEETSYNLGLSHGIPSIVVILSLLLGYNIEAYKTNEMIKGTINWLLDKMDGNFTKYLFPTAYPSEKPYKSRVAWCYGDLGISMALLIAGKTANNRHWYNEAISIALNVSQIRNIESGVMDTSFCHGTAGNAHIFNRLYNYTGVEEFKETALYWYGETLNFYEKNGHFKFFTRDKDGSNPRWEDRVGILEGLAGVGLVLISAISDIEPKWDRCLLLS